MSNEEALGILGVSNLSLQYLTQQKNEAEDSDLD